MADVHVDAWNEELWAGFDEEAAGHDQERPAATVAGPARDGNKASIAPNLPAEFWTARPYLTKIRDAAHYYGRSADSVLGFTLARLSAMVGPHLKFDAGVGPGSLNLFCALVGPSGAGKSRSMDVAMDLMPYRPPHLEGDRFPDGIGLGSGEGMAEQYMGMVEEETGEFHTRASKGANKGDPKTRLVRKQVRENVFFYLDEGEQLTKTIERTGTTIGPAIRSAWVGTTLGQANARAETTRILTAGSYAMGMVIGYQFDTAQPLIADVGPGTPQRFLWLSATDPSIPRKRTDRPLWPGDLKVRLDNGSFGPIRGVLEMAEEIKEEVWNCTNARARGDVVDDDQDSHKPLMLCKVSTLLSLLDEARWDLAWTERGPGADDWPLAKLLWHTSAAVRDFTAAHGKKKVEAEIEAKTAAYVDRDLRAHLAKSAANDQVERVARLIGRHVHEDGAVSRGAERKRLAGRDKPVFEAAVSYAVARGWVAPLDDRILTTGDAVPA